MYVLYRLRQHHFGFHQTTLIGFSTRDERIPDDMDWATWMRSLRARRCLKWWMDGDHNFCAIYMRSSFIHNLSYSILSKILGIKVGTECTVTSVVMAGVGATTSLEGHGWVVDSVDVSGCPLYLAAIPYVEAQWREPKHRILPNDFGKDGDVAWYLAADTAEASQHGSRSRHGEPRDQRLGFDPPLFPSFKKGMRIMRMSLGGVSPELKCHMIHWDSASGIR